MSSQYVADMRREFRKAALGLKDEGRAAALNTRTGVRLMGVRIMREDPDALRALALMENPVFAAVAPLIGPRGVFAAVYARTLWSACSLAAPKEIGPMIGSLCIPHIRLAHEPGAMRMPSKAYEELCSLSAMFTEGLKELELDVLRQGKEEHSGHAYCQIFDSISSPAAALQLLANRCSISVEVASHLVAAMAVQNFHQRWGMGGSAVHQREAP